MFRLLNIMILSVGYFTYRQVNNKIDVDFIFTLRNIGHVKRIVTIKNKHNRQKAEGNPLDARNFKFESKCKRLHINSGSRQTYLIFHQQNYYYS